MLNKDETRTRVEAELLSGKEPRELSEGSYFDKYKTPYITILNWKKKLATQAVDDNIHDLTRHTQATLEVIKDAAKEKAPSVVGKIDKIIDGVGGLKLLEPHFHTAMNKAVKKASEFLDETDDDGKSTLSIKEWQMITTTLSQAYAALFNKGGTTVNVAQNNINASENMSFFKASQKKL